jgi:hypothetical protein
MVRLYGNCAKCGYWYEETLWFSRGDNVVPSEMNEAKDHPCECGGVVVEVIR